MAGGLLDDDWKALFAAGSAHIVGLVTAAGAPFVSRGWGITFSPDGSHGTVLLGATEVEALGYPAGDPRGSMIAMTCTHVRSLRSAQIKGPIESVRPGDAPDRAVLDRYCDQFFDAVLEVDMISRTLMERLVPDEIVACTFAIVEAYEQTPGPGAGRTLGTPVP
jgi:hypothetical protein